MRDRQARADSFHGSDYPPFISPLNPTTVALLLAMSDDSSKGSPETEERNEEEEEQGEGIRESGEEPKESLTCELQPERQPQAELEDGDREAEIQGGDQRREEREVGKEEEDPGTSAQAKREERMKRLRELHLRRVRVTRVQSMYT